MGRQIWRRGGFVLVFAIVVGGFMVQLELLAMDRTREMAGVEPRRASPTDQLPPVRDPESLPRDYWVTPPDTGDGGTYQDLTVPAGFFGPACEAFQGRVYFRGSPLDPEVTGSVDTVLRRSADPILPTDAVGTARTVSLELEKLSLVSIQPITVMCGGEPQGWMVHVGLSPEPVPIGSLTATKTHAGGGTFDSTIYVQPFLTFTNVDDPDQVLILDTAAVSNPVEFQATRAPFVCEASSVPGDAATKPIAFVFGAGVTAPLEGGPPRSAPTRVRHEAPGHEHTVCLPCEDFPAPGPMTMESGMELYLYIDGEFVEATPFDSLLTVTIEPAFINPQGLCQFDFVATSWDVMGHSEWLDRNISFTLTPGVDQPVGTCIAQTESAEFPATLTFRVIYDATIEDLTTIPALFGEASGSVMSVPPGTAGLTVTKSFSYYDMEYIGGLCAFSVSRKPCRVH